MTEIPFVGFLSEREIRLINGGVHLADNTVHVYIPVSAATC